MSKRASSKTLGEVVDNYRDVLNIMHLDFSGTELVEEISKLRDERWISVEGLVAEIRDMRKNAIENSLNPSLTMGGRDKQTVKFWEGNYRAFDEVLVLLYVKEQKKRLSVIEAAANLQKVIDEEQKKETKTMSCPKCGTALIINNYCPKCMRVFCNSELEAQKKETEP